MAERSFSPNLDDLIAARRSSATQQWQAAIAAQQQREAMKPSTGEQIGNIINWNLSRAIYGNPLAQIAQMYQEIAAGQLDPASPQGAGRGLRTAAAVALEGAPYAKPGTVGMTGGKPFWEKIPGVYMPPNQATRISVLDKLIANRDFRPEIRDSRLWFKSLSPAENEVMNRIGWSRADNVTWEDEISPERSSWAWEQNLRYWRNLAGPDRS